MANVIIIGSGPAGVSAALYTARAGLDTLVLSMGTGSLKKAEAIQNYYGFASPVSGEELTASGIEGAKNVGVKFLDEEVVGINFEDKLVIETTVGLHKADNVLIATGSQRAMPPIKGLADLEGRGVSYCAVCDAFFYRGKNVAVIGNGEYAAHEIAALSPVASSVTLLTNGAEPTADFPDFVTIIDKKISSVLGQAPAGAPEGTPARVSAVEFEDGSKLDTDGVFIAYGVAGSTALARKIGAKIDGNRIVVDENMATNIPGLYAAGDCTGGLLQVAKAVYEGAVAGTAIVKRSRTL